MKVRPIQPAQGKHRTFVGIAYADYLTDYELGKRERLTLREFQILESYANGNGTTKEVALHLGISRWTVQHHTKIIRAKLGESTTANCVFRGLKEGWLMMKEGDAR